MTPRALTPVQGNGPVRVLQGASKRRPPGDPNAPTTASLNGNPADNHIVHSVETALKSLRTWYPRPLGDEVPEGISVTTLCDILLWANTVDKAAIRAEVIRSVVYVLKDIEFRVTVERVVDLAERKLAAVVDAAVEKFDGALARLPPAAPLPPPPLSQPLGTRHSSEDLLLSYAAVAGRDLPKQHASMVQRNVARRRQVVLEHVGESVAGVGPLTEKELVLKAHLAIDKMGQDATADAPEGLVFRGARKLRSGAIVFELASEEAADWLRQEEVKKAFTAAYDGGQSAVKQTAFLVIAEFVPVSFCPHDPVFLRKVEGHADLADYSILSGRWIKPVERRPPSQRVAHAILHMRTPEAANQAIRNGLHIEGKSVSVRKLLQEPRRCMKCQQIGTSHVAATCPAPHDICGTCGGSHKTAECTVQSPADWHCVNCHTTGHAAWDRDCPHYVDKSERLNARTPANWYRFFPTANPATWEQIGQGGEARSQVDTWVRPSRPGSQPRAPSPPCGPSPHSQQLARQPDTSTRNSRPPSDLSQRAVRRAPRGRSSHLPPRDPLQASLEDWLAGPTQRPEPVPEEGEIPSEGGVETGGPKPNDGNTPSLSQ